HTPTALLRRHSRRGVGRSLHRWTHIPSADLAHRTQRPLDGIRSPREPQPPAHCSTFERSCTRPRTHEEDPLLETPQVSRPVVELTERQLSDLLVRSGVLGESTVYLAEVRDEHAP